MFMSRRGPRADPRVGQSGEERFRENEGFELRVVRELRPTPAGRFHDDMHVAIFRKGRKVQEIRHGEGSHGCKCAAQRRKRRTDAKDNRYLSDGSQGEMMREY